MKRMLWAFALLVTFDIIPAAAGEISGLVDYDSYEDCILENMKGVGSDVAAWQIMDACREKFPLPLKSEPEQEPLKCSTVEIKILEAKTYEVGPGWFLGEQSNVRLILSFKNTSEKPLKYLEFYYANGKDEDCENVKLKKIDSKDTTVPPGQESVYGVLVKISPETKKLCYRLEATGCS